MNQCVYETVVRTFVPRGPPILWATTTVVHCEPSTMQVQLQRTGMKVPVVTLLPMSDEVLEE